MTSAVCALAALHHSRMQVATFSDHNPGQSMSQYFYNEAWTRLQASKHTLGHYTEHDAIASLHLLSYSLLSRGQTDWRYVLDVSCEWLSQTGLTMAEDPKFTMSNMTSSQQFILKTTMVRPHLINTIRAVVEQFVDSLLCSGWTPSQA